MAAQDLICRKAFQSTHPCGVRHRPRHWQKSLRVSIHAPVWGATKNYQLNFLLPCFNPRTRVGCDHISTILRCVCKFQSTHPCGVRRRAQQQADLMSVSIHAPVWGATASQAMTSPKAGFNPRTRVGCDFYHQEYLSTPAVSIHAPVWGATKVNPVNKDGTMFQSTHPCGVRHH